MKKLFLILLMFVSSQLLAQTEKPKPTIEIEVDPLAYLLKGYSFHAIYQPGRFRFDAATYGLHLPGKFQGNDGFNLKMQGFGFKTHYLLQGTNGFYTGLGIGYLATEALHRQSGAQKRGRSIGMGPEFGYRFFFRKPREGVFKGFYLQPWVSYGYSIPLSKIKFENATYKQKRWEYFAAFHVGYRF
jgi:hypothetical protein